MGRKTQKSLKLRRISDLKILQFYKMPGRKKKTTEEPKPVQNSSNCPEQENNPDNPGGPIKCSCPMGKHPNNSRTCNKKNQNKIPRKSRKWIVIPTPILSPILKCQKCLRYLKRQKLPRNLSRNPPRNPRRFQVKLQLPSLMKIRI